MLSRRSAAVLAVLAALGERARADNGAASEPVQPKALPAPPGPKLGAAVEPVIKDQVVAIMGHAVTGPDGQQIGRIVDVLVDSAGHPRAAVIDVGGFMGVGTRAIAVEWKTLRFEPWSKDAAIALQMTLDQIKAMPAYKGLPEDHAAPIVVPAAPEPHAPAANQKGNATKAVPPKAASGTPATPAAKQ